MVDLTSFQFGWYAPPRGRRRDSSQMFRHSIVLRRRMAFSFWSAPFVTDKLRYYGAAMKEIGITYLWVKSTMAYGPEAAIATGKICEFKNPKFNTPSRLCKHLDGPKRPKMRMRQSVASSVDMAAGPSENRHLFGRSHHHRNTLVRPPLRHRRSAGLPPLPGAARRLP